MTEWCPQHLSDISVHGICNLLYFPLVHTFQQKALHMIYLIPQLLLLSIASHLINALSYFLLQMFPGIVFFFFFVIVFCMSWPFFPLEWNLWFEPICNVRYIICSEALYLKLLQWKDMGPTNLMHEKTQVFDDVLIMYEFVQCDCMEMYNIWGVGWGE